MGPIASGRAALASLRRYDARLELGGLHAVSALFLAWPISAILIVLVRYVSFGEIKLFWALPCIAFPLFWPALVLLPAAAHIPTQLLPLVFTIAGLGVNTQIWLPLFEVGMTSPGQTLVGSINSGTIYILPSIIYGSALAWLARGRERSGTATMRALRPYRAAILSLCVLAIIWFGLPFLILDHWLTPFPTGDLGGLGVFLGIVVGGLIFSFPWMALIAGMATISITHGIPRPYAAPTFLAVMFAACPLKLSLPTSNVLALTLSCDLILLDTSYYRCFNSLSPISIGSPIVGTAIYGIILWATRRKTMRRRSVSKSHAPRPI